MKKNKNRYLLTMIGVACLSVVVLGLSMESAGAAGSDIMLKDSRNKVIMQLDADTEFLVNGSATGLNVQVERKTANGKREAHFSYWNRSNNEQFPDSSVKINGEPAEIGLVVNSSERNSNRMKCTLTNGQTKTYSLDYDLIRKYKNWLRVGRSPIVAATLNSGDLPTKCWGYRKAIGRSWGKTRWNWGYNRGRWGGTLLDEQPAAPQAVDSYMEPMDNEDFNNVYEEDMYADDYAPEPMMPDYDSYDYGNAPEYSPMLGATMIDEEDGDTTMNDLKTQQEVIINLLEEVINLLQNR